MIHQQSRVLTKNLLVGHRILLGFATPVVALIAIGFLSLRNLDEMQRQQNWVSHTNIVMNELGVLRNAVSRLESSGRGYFISGQDPLKAELAVQLAASRDSSRRLKELIKDNPTQTERMEQLTAAIVQRGELSRELIALRDSGATGTEPRVGDVVRQGQNSSDQIWAITDAMNQEETRLLEERIAASGEAGAVTRNTVIYGSIGALLIIAMSGAILSRSITGPLEKLRGSASRLGQGDYAHRVAVVAEDEVGHLGRVFNSMAEQVQRRQAVLADQDWLKSGLASFQPLFQQQRDANRLCHLVLTEIANLIEARRSVIYRALSSDSGTVLELCASYAADNPPPRLAPGQNLVGQCFAEKRRIALTGLPPDYIRIGSALGEARPTSVLVEPVLFEGEVKAVIELASLQPFTALQLEFIGQLANNLGIVLQTVETTARTEHLLRESQALTLKLEEQQRALGDKNVELEAQTDRLRKSEVLLQEQQVELTQSNEELEQSNEELQQSNEEMEEKTNLLAQQKRELEVSNREIEQGRRELQEQTRQLALTSKYKSNFLATMSHELRTPLNSLLILARLLSENRDANLNPKQIQFAQTIESSGSDLLEMINQILDLAKIESGTVELHLDEVTPADLQRSVDQQFRHVADTRKLNFEVSLAPGLPATIRTDVGRLYQVLKNLLSNAFKFTERGSVKVGIKLATEGWKRSSLSLAQAPGVIEISVTDTGIGIPADKQQLVFEAFQQGDVGTARRFGGTGLGLSISREIAALLGGVLQLQSEPGVGSTFTLYLPTAFDAAAAQSSAAEARATPPVRAAEPAPAPAPTHPIDPSEWEDPQNLDDRATITPQDRVILIIEDDQRFSNILVDFAHEQRFKALVARSARGALALAQQFLPVAITLDLRLVDEDGWVVLDRLKHDPRTRHIPVHVISVDPARGRGLRLGAVSYLQKPVSQEAIREILQRTVEFIERPVKNLLVVEDNDVQRQTICELIGNGDVHTTAVASAAEALAAFDREQFDCVVMDLMLPDLSGVDLIREINRRLGLNTPPVIVYTGKELTPREETELRSLSESIIVKDARSPERLLDETALFLHRVQARLPEAKRRMLDQVRKQDAVLTGRRVLVVDDDVRNIFALTARLESFGMIVRFAESGQAAIDLLQADPHCDVVLMDVMMPGMDGYETMRRLRKDSRFAKLPIISVTAKAMKADRERSIEAGASDYITKPVDTEKLISLLRVWLYR